MFRKTTGTTLLELIIVIVMLGVLATLGVTHYGSYRERTLDKEAQANLKLIIAAERIYKMEIGNYYVSASIADINSNLSLFLSSADERSWNYSTASADAASCCAQATRNGGDARNWRMRNTEAEPVVGTCP